MLLNASEVPVGGGSVFHVVIIPVILLIGLLCYGVIKFTKKHLADVRMGRVNKFNRLFIVLCILGGLIDFLIIGLLTGCGFTFSEILLYLIILFVPGVVTQGLYFLPYLIANKKHHRQETAIFILNLFAGWTIIAWVIALVWACTESKQQTVIQQTNIMSSADELKKYVELLDQGIITQEEFDAKKKQIMDI